jgi:hypothetical protein
MLGKFTMEPVGPFASTVICDGTPVNVGPVVSCTVMLKFLGGDVLLDVSLAVQLTVVVPTA